MANRLKQRLDLISNGSSPPNAAVSWSNVYNSAQIRKQFEISSEKQDYATLGRQQPPGGRGGAQRHRGGQFDGRGRKGSGGVYLGGCCSEGAEKDAPETSKESAASSVKEESSLKSSESSEVDSCTASSALNTAEETNLYASNARKFNGISSTSGSELDDKSAVQSPANVTTTAASTTTTTTAANELGLTQALTPEYALYEVSVWFDGAELQFLSVEKVIENKLAAPAAFGETGRRFTLKRNGQFGDTLQPVEAPLSKVKHTVRGAKALASMVIEEFTKIKRALSKDDELSDAELDQSSSNAKTPKTSPLFQVQERMLRSPTRHTFFRPR
ncbi:hypothetical protein pipiens_005799 [Culex pipiens pipiens]|uniref:Uncharacterized protein n=1 Tax=Culex pipiens pipiens TaxID=38569 RepID=A0ABD1DTS2_CULPP